MPTRRPSGLRRSLPRRLRRLLPASLTDRMRRSRARTRADLLVSRFRHRGNRVRTVCVLVGPYRNLTTLTGAVMSLHPHCQVLNHGGDRILPFQQVDFIARYSDERLQRFIRYAIHISGSGAAGWWGGTITESHAFKRRDKPSLLYIERYGDRLVKPEIHALLWKESMVVRNHMRDTGTSADELLAASPRLRLLMPIRHPLDCARSNLNTGHVELLRPRSRELPDVVDAILDEIAWLADLRERHPEQCSSFFEHELGVPMLHRLAAFLGLEAEERWVDDAVACFSVESKYEHPPELVDHYLRAVDARFVPGSEIHRGLTRFVAASAGAV